MIRCKICRRQLKFSKYRLQYPATDHESELNSEENPTTRVVGSGNSGQLLTGVTARAVRVVSDFDGRRRDVDDSANGDLLFGITFTVIPKVSHNMVSCFVGGIELLATSVANGFPSIFGMRLSRDGLSVGLLDPVVTKGRGDGLGLSLTAAALIGANTVSRAGCSRFAYDFEVVSMYRRLAGTARTA